MTAEAKSSRPLRVELTIGSLELGGAERQLVGLARELKEAGVDVGVAALTGGGPLEAVLSEAGIPCFCARFGGFRSSGRTRSRRPWAFLVELLRLLSLVRHLRRRRPDVLHAYLFHSYALMVPMAWVLRVPVRVAARRGLHDALARHPLERVLTLLSVRLATAVVANARAVADDAHEHEAVPLDKLSVIPNAVVCPDRVADPGIEPPVGVLLANLLRYKGHLDLIEALRLLDAPPVVRLVGEGPMRPELEEAIDAAGLRAVVRLEGRLADPRPLMAGAQFALLVSHTEGMPNAVLEAMAAGLPVIATDVGGCRELVVDGVTGLLVPPHDPARLATAIARLVADRQFRLDAGCAGRQRAEAQGWGACASAHLDLYHRLLGEARPDLRA